MGEKGIGRQRTMCVSVRALSHPMLLTKERSGFIQNELADTTDREQRCLASRSRRNRMSHLGGYAIRSHSYLLEMSPRPDWIFLEHTFVQSLLILGFPPVLSMIIRRRPAWYGSATNFRYS